MTRQIAGLLWAKAGQRPAGLPKRRPRGAKAAGLRYEASLARALPNCEHGRWFTFEDRNGPGWCQPDLLLWQASTLVVLEAKYTWTAEGHRQLEGLYLPVLRWAMDRPALGIVVCRRLVPNMPVRVVATLSEGITLARRGERVAWHWQGVPGLASQAEAAAVAA